MVTQGVVEAGQEPPRERVYPPVGTPALDLLYDTLDTEAQSFRQLDGRAAAGLAGAPPIARHEIPV
jgi:mannosyl-3-phosphoglycerate synthase